MTDKYEKTDSKVYFHPIIMCELGSESLLFSKQPKIVHVGTTDLSQLEPLFNNLQNCTWRQGLHEFAKPHRHLSGPINNKPTIGSRLLVYLIAKYLDIGTQPPAHRHLN